ncbi:MAG TPA: YjbF family lipoprotein [Acetobacteraceae bacterium]|nr:YjbF family lipoprotein [Acetobacteraceae bacterium]
MRTWPLLLALLAAGCGQATTADVVRVLVWPIPVPDSLFSRTPSDRPAEWDRGGAPALGGLPALTLSLGRRQAVATLHQTQGERRLWRTAGGLVVATDGARVVATSGLQEMVATTRFDGPDPLAAPLALRDAEASARRVVDLMRLGRQPDGMSFGLTLDCRLRVAEADEEALLIEERCRGDESFTNRFWADPRTGAVFRSEQWIGRRMPPLIVEVLSPPPAS